MRTNAIEVWAPKALQRNPFKFEGKTVGFWAEISRFVDKTSVVVRRPGRGALLVRGLDANFVGDAKEIALAARVKGLAEIKTALGATSIPELEFVGMHICEVRTCDELTAWQTTIGSIDLNFQRKREIWRERLSLEAHESSGWIDITGGCFRFAKDGAELWYQSSNGDPKRYTGGQIQAQKLQFRAPARRIYPVVWVYLPDERGTCSWG